jgi:hypothetical protein
MICHIDIYALLSANGTGMFVEVLSKQNMLPSPEKCLAPTLQPRLGTFLPEERPYFPGAMRLNQEVLLLALQVGQIARDLRAEATQRLFGDPAQMISESIYITSRRTRIQTLHHLIQHCRDIWKIEFPDYWTSLNGPEPLPERVFACVTHV